MDVLAPTASSLKLERLTGSVIAGKFYILEQIGEGGMGFVYKARHLTLDKLVCVKILRPQLVTNATVVSRFEREAKAASRLNHPHSIQVLDFGHIDSGGFYIVMEFIEGRDLAAVLAEEWPLTELRVCHIAAQVLSALAAAHAANVIHRDLKPENIMLQKLPDDPDFVKVLDFGIAKVMGPELPGLTRGDLVCGTPQYMSPEQATGAAIDARSDIYAVGVVLYRMVTGFLPFEGRNPMEFLTKHASEKPLPPRIRRPDVRLSRDLETLIMRALEKDPARRPQTAEDFRRELLRIEAERRVEGADGGGFGLVSGNGGVLSGRISGIGPGGTAGFGVSSGLGAGGLGASGSLGGFGASGSFGTGGLGATGPGALSSPGGAGGLSTPGIAGGFSAPGVGGLSAPGIPGGFGTPGPSGPFDAPGAPGGLGLGLGGPLASNPPPVRTPSGFGASASLEPKGPSTPSVILPGRTSPANMTGISPLGAVPTLLHNNAGTDPTMAEAAPGGSWPGAPTRAHQTRVSIETGTDFTNTVAAMRKARNRRRLIIGTVLTVVVGGGLFVAWPLITSDWWPNRQAYYDAAIAKLSALSQQYLKSGPDAQIHIEPAHPENTVVKAPPPPPPPPPPPSRPHLRRSSGGESAEATALATGEQPAGAADGTCPGGSIFIPNGERGFCIDEYEFPNQKGSPPTVWRDWHAAEDSCKQRLRRLCTADEWQKACAGPRGSTYSMAAGAANATGCNFSDDKGVHHPVTASGSQKTCKSGYGVADLSGNVAEWTATPAPEDPSRKLVMGGSAGDPMALIRCNARAPVPVSTQNELVGFRCCADPLE